MIKRSLFWVFTAITFLIVACKKKDKSPDPSESFDRAGMLGNYFDQRIVPAYQTFQTKVNDLKTATDAFCNTPTSPNLSALQTAFYQAYLSWQDCEPYELGPADDKQMRFNTNYFPTDTVTVTNNIQNNNTSVSFLTSALVNVKGLPAIDYLIHLRSGNASTLLDLFTTDVHAAKRKVYLQSLVTLIKDNTDYVVTQWAGYRDTFISQTGTDAGSSLSALVNQLAFTVDLIKRERTGVPSGYVGNTPTATLVPTSAEAYFSNKPFEMMQANLQSLETFYTGGSGLGLDDYLAHIGAQSYNSQPLATEIQNQINICQTKLAAIGPDFLQTLDSNKSLIDDLFLEYKKLLILIKVDTPSAVGVAITYVDNDGD